MVRMYYKAEIIIVAEEERVGDNLKPFDTICSDINDGMEHTIRECLEDDIFENAKVTVVRKTLYIEEDERHWEWRHGGYELPGKPE